MARPTMFTDDILSKTQEYIDSCEDQVENVVAGESDTFTKYQIRIKVKLPTIEGLARYLKIHKDTVYTWRKEKPAFSDLIDDLLAKQADALINNGLSGNYNSTIAKVLLTKHGYTDKQEIDQRTELSGTVGFSGIQIVQPDDPNPQVPS